MIKRLLTLPAFPTESFFLWGPRQAGKSSLLKATYPGATYIDLLKSDDFVRYTSHPERLREELLAKGPTALVIIDEIQKVPGLLDEVHWLIENTGTIFALCGSSARKVRRGHANLLGGRAILRELHGFVSAEIGAGFDLQRMLNHGYLPRHYLAEAPKNRLRAYVNDYLKEEIAAEGLVRRLPSFATFLDSAALSDTDLVSYSAIARDCGVSGPAVKEYYQIMVDTMLGRFLAPYRKRPKRRVIQAPKFYFADVGVAGMLARRGPVAPGSELFGKALENWVCHELHAHREYSDLFYDLTYWRLSSGIEVDFVVNDMEVAIEAKGTPRVTADHLGGLRQVIADHPRVKRRILVCLEPKRRQTADGIDVLPAHDFVADLWQRNLGLA